MAPAISVLDPRRARAPPSPAALYVARPDARLRRAGAALAAAGRPRAAVALGNAQAAQGHLTGQDLRQAWTPTPVGGAWGDLVPKVPRAGLPLLARGSAQPEHMVRPVPADFLNGQELPGPKQLGPEIRSPERPEHLISPELGSLANLGAASSL